MSNQAKVDTKKREVLSDDYLLESGASAGRKSVSKGKGTSKRLKTSDELEAGLKAIEMRIIQAESRDKGKNQQALVFLYVTKIDFLVKLGREKSESQFIDQVLGELTLVIGKIVKERVRAEHAERDKLSEDLGKLYRLRAEARYLIGKDKYALRDLEESQKVDPDHNDEVNKIMIKYADARLKKSRCLLL